MSTINVSNLTFSYDNNDNIFENVSFSIDTNWKLGFIGRNGRGKTTFLNLLLEKYEYYGKIVSDVNFDYFPFEVENENLNSYEIASTIEKWKLEKEVTLLNMSLEVLKRPFRTLSSGEKTKVLLAMLFSKENNFLLIDEPTNHLDIEARKSISNYLKKKHSFILVSHDRSFLDSCVDHILSINKTNIEISQGNFSIWYENKILKDNYEINKNEKLKKEISRLEESAKRMSDWSDKVESSKYRPVKDHFIDKGYIGHKSAKMMKRSLVASSHKEKAIEDKSKLLKNIETMEELKLYPLEYKKNKLLSISKLSIYYKDNILFKDLDIEINSKDRVQLKGKNGCGKSSIIKLLLGENITYNGELNKPKDLKISYVSQDTKDLKGTLTSLAYDNNIDEVLFKAILRKLGFDRENFDINIENYSEGQKKKVLIAKSLSEQANIYIWDEPLNYIDIFSRIQIEDLILKYNPTMIFVEHDESFSNKIATKVINIR